MATKIKELTPPKGISRAFFRFPIYLYRAGLGGMLGDRFLLINHIGRKTGLPRQAVVEVVYHDQEADSYYVVAAYGNKTAWYNNLMAAPEVTIQVGRRKLEVVAEVVPAEQAGLIFRGYIERFPAGKNIVKMVGYEVDGTLEDYQRVGQEMNMVAFRPR